MNSEKDSELFEMLGSFSKAKKKSYNQGYSDAKSEYEALINVLKSDIDNGLVREILLKNKITKLENQIKRG
jgi:hypothetical protein